MEKSLRRKSRATQKIKDEARSEREDTTDI
jgi:hypothetical protein